MLKIKDRKFYDGDLLVKTKDGREGLAGVNESMVPTYMQGVAIGALNARYHFYNMNFPKYVGENTQIPAATDREFFWKYGWLISHLGGDIEAMVDDGSGKKVLTKGTTSLNHARFGPANSHGGDYQVRCFREKRSYNDQVMRDLLDMMHANGVYVTYNLGWSPGADNVFKSDVCELDSQGYKDFVQYCIDYIAAYCQHPAIAGFDIFNEAHVYGNIEGYWIPKYGDKHLEVFDAWKNRLLTDVKAGVRAKIVGDMPLIFIGHTYGPFVNYWLWDTHTQADLNNEIATTAKANLNQDVMTVHQYFSAEDDYLLKFDSRAASDVGKHLYWEELANAPNQAPWDYSYWPWCDIVSRKYGLSVCWMLLKGLDAVPAINRAAMPAYPGYPISPAVMAAIPAMPPEQPLPEQPAKIVITLPPGNQGSISVQLPANDWLSLRIVLPK